MLHSLGRWLYRAARPVIAVVVPRDQPRVRVEIRHKNQILLVKSWFSNQNWELPGGGVNRGEAPTRAAVREILEETGLLIDRKRLAYLTTLPAHYPLKCDLIVYVTTVKKNQLNPLRWKYSLEIIDRKWYDIDKLPENIGVFSKSVIQRDFEDAD